MVEEIEHKTVAFDTYMAYSGQYLPRVFGMFHGSLHVLWFGPAGMFTALKKDKLLNCPQQLMSVLREILSMTFRVGPYLLRVLLPWHNPRCEGDPQWMKDWVAGHATLPAGTLLPLIDTNGPEMPPPFAAAHIKRSISNIAYTVYRDKMGTMERLDRIMIANGLVVVLIAMLAGFM